MWSYDHTVVVLIEHVQSIGGIHTTRDVVRHETKKLARFLRTFVRGLVRPTSLRIRRRTQCERPLSGIVVLSVFIDKMRKLLVCYYGTMIADHSMKDCD